MLLACVNCIESIYKVFPEMNESILKELGKVLYERSLVTSLLTCFAAILSAFIIAELSGRIVSLRTAGVLTFILPIAIYLLGALWLILERIRMMKEIEKIDEALLPTKVKSYLKSLL